MAEHEDDEARHEELGWHDPSRVLALSDGVFAIIMTLLVLDLNVPPEEHGPRLAAALIEDSLPTLLAYTVGFLLAGVYWIGHRDLFSQVKRVTYGVLWMNILFLMAATLIPFAASLIGKHGEEPVALEVYGGLLTVLAAIRLGLFRFVTARPQLLLRPMPEGHRRRVTRIMTLAIAAFFLSVAAVPYIPVEIVLVVYGGTPIIVLAAIRNAELARRR